MKVNVIGAGFAGVEAAYFLASKGIQVDLYEMRSKKMTPAHKTANFAELVCSNSFKSNSLENAHGLLKGELKELGSIVLEIAEKNKVPAGAALAVDREKFAENITDIIKNHKNINFINEEITDLNNFNDDKTIIATGPLTSQKLTSYLNEIIGSDFLYFFDAAAPVIDAENIDYNKAFFQSRYDKGTPDYINCPLNKEEYYQLVDEIKNAEKAELKEFESKKIFEGCIPIEVLAERGIDTLAFGPMKPVGIFDPKTGKRPYAVLQLRQENSSKSMFNMVGFQTRLKWNEQKRIFRMIPGLEKAEFLRYGVMHKNIFLNFPKIINKSTYSLNSKNNLYFAGQITGVEGYIESAASGLYTAYALWSNINNYDILFPENTLTGALQNYTLTENINYQPIASNFGLFNQDIFNDKGKKLKGRDKKKALSENAIKNIKDFILENNI